MEEGLAPPVFRSLADSARVLRLIEGTLSTVEVDAEAMMAQAARHFATCTELAAVIHRHTSLAFRTAHRIVGNLVLKAIKRGVDATQVDAALVDESANDILGEPLGLSDEQIRQALHPAEFVKVHNIVGGPAPEALYASVQRSRERLEADRKRISERQQRLRRRAREEGVARLAAG